MFGDKPLSHYLLGTEAAGNTLQARPQHDVQTCQVGSSAEEPLAGLYFLSADMYNPTYNSTYIFPFSFPSEQVSEIKWADSNH